jgi:hypothetical protein
MNTLLLASLALVAPAGRAQDVAQKVTFSAPAGRASVVLKKLGEQTGIALETSRQTEDEVLLLSFKDVPLKEVMDRIASVADAEWKPEGSGFRLSRPSEKQSEAARKELETRTDTIGKVLQGALDRQAKLPAWNDAELKKLVDMQQKHREQLNRPIEAGGATTFRMVDNAQLTEQAPGGRVVIALLGAIGAKKLAGISLGDRVVYALNPTQMQYPLPVNAAKLINQFVEQQRQYAEATRKRTAANDDGRVMIVQGMSGPEMGAGDPSLGVGQALLVLNRFGDMVRASLTVADRNGDSIASASWNVQTTPSPPKPAGPNEEALELSPLGAEFAKAATGAAAGMAGRGMVVRLATSTSSGGNFTFDSSQNTPPVPISDALRNYLLRPEENDPQALVVGDAFTQAAKKTHKNIIASLPDSAIVPLARRFANEKVTVPALLGWMGGSLGLRIDASEAWLQISPIAPVTARRFAMDRPALGKLLRTIQTQGYARLDDMAPLVNAQHKAVAAMDFDGQALRLINAGAAQNAMTALSEPHTLRLYSSLTQTQRNVLGNGGAIAFAQLNPAQRAHIGTDVFTSMDGPQIKQANSAPQNFRGVFIDFGSVLNERTQVLPGGLPANGQFRVNTDRQLSAYGIDTKTGAAGVVTPSALASSRLMGERSDLSFLGAAPKYDQFLPAQQVQYTFSYELSPTASLTRQLNDASIDLKAPRVGFDGLSADFKQQVNSTLESMRNGFGQVRLGGAPARTIPPKP